MDILKNDDGTSYMKVEYPIDYHSKVFWSAYGHEAFAKIISEKKLKTYCIVVVADMLDEKHWDDPQYVHEKNSIVVSEAREEARRNLVNRYYSQEALDDIIKKHGLATKEFNYREDEGRDFKRRLEDEIFDFQEAVEEFKIIQDSLELAKFKLDEEGYPVEDENENMIEETDPEIIEKQKIAIMEKIMMPRTMTRCERVYNMPRPLSHWDSRSPWHQFFFVEIPEENITLAARGNAGSSGAREHNGLWAHAFACLSGDYGIETPTFFTKYTKDNEWVEIMRQDVFGCLARDLSGNYPSDRETKKRLFSGKLWTHSGGWDSEQTYEKLSTDDYW